MLSVRRRKAAGRSLRVPGPVGPAPLLSAAAAMDSDEGYNYEFDEDEECSEDSGAEEDEDEPDEEDEPDLDLGEVELVEPGLGVGGERDGLLCGETGGLGPGGGGGGGLGGSGLGGPGPGGGGGLGHEQEEDYRYEVLTAEQILQHMVECIREVNEVIQVRALAGFARSHALGEEEEEGGRGWSGWARWGPPLPRKNAGCGQERARGESAAACCSHAFQALGHSGEGPLPFIQPLFVVKLGGGLGEPRD